MFSTALGTRTALFEPEMTANALWIATRLFYLAAAATLAFCIARGRARRYGIVLLCLLLAIGWFASNYGLPRIYGLLVPGDRARNLSWCMSAAAGNSLWGTGVIGQTTLEPFWAALVSAMSLWSPDRTLVLYPYLSLLGLTAVAISLYLHFRRFDHSGDRVEGGPTHELLGLVVAASATLLATSSLDYLGPFRGYWAKMFLLKPNHTVGFILVPIVVGFLVQARRRAAWIGGLLLGLLGLAFVIHWAFVCFSLVIYVVLTASLRRPMLGIELRRSVIAVSLSAIFVAPTLYLIATYFPHALTLSAGSYPDAPMRSDWGDTIPAGVSLLFLVTLEQGLLFFLALYGVFRWIRERTRASLTWASLLLGAYLLWGINYLLYITSRAREADEFYFFLIFVQAIAAGYGAHRLASFFGRRLLSSASARQRILVLGVCMAAPLGFPFWWNPEAMDNHYRVALVPVWPPIVQATDWIRRETQGSDIFLASVEQFQWIPALSGRRARVFEEPLRAPFLELLDEPDDSEKARALNLDYIVWDRSLLAELGVSDARLQGSRCCEMVLDAPPIRIYEIVSGRRSRRALDR